MDSKVNISNGNSSQELKATPGKRDRDINRKETIFTCNLNNISHEQTYDAICNISCAQL